MNQFPRALFSAPPIGVVLVFYFFSAPRRRSYFLAVLIDLFSSPEDRPLARRLLHLVSCIVISGLLLTLDLSRPERFCIC